MNSYTIERAKKEYLTGLRGKQRAKMTFAILQAEIEVDHTHGLFDDHLRNQKPAIDAAIHIANENLVKFAKQFREYVDGVRENLALLVSPFPITSERVTPISMRYDFYNNILADMEWEIQRAAEQNFRAVLLDYRKTLGDNSSKPSIALTDDERTEIVKAVTFTKQLQAHNGAPDTEAR